jgi:hypothetical protein
MLVAHRSVIVGELDALRAELGPHEAYPIFHIDGDRMLALPVLFERVEAIRTRQSEVREGRGVVELRESALRSRPELARACPTGGLAVDAVEGIRRALVPKAVDH